MLYVEVILPLGFEGCLTYAVSDELAARISVGMRVVAPLGKSKRYTGIVSKILTEKPDFAVKEIVSVEDTKPVVLPKQLEMWQWISSYYMAPIGDVFSAALPAGLKAEEGYRPKTETFVRLTEKLRSAEPLHLALDSLRRSQRQQEVFGKYLELSGWNTATSDNASHDNIKEVARDELMNETHCSSAILSALVERGYLERYELPLRLSPKGEDMTQDMKELSAAQSKAKEEITEQWKTKDVVLLHGVTSGGKTEIYIHLINEVLCQGGQVMYLLPEIGLTVQMTERLRRVFGQQLAVYHSKYSDTERVEIWQRQLSDSPYGIILGARSAVFLPYKNLKLIIVDEEHDSSYKQQDPAPRYHARSTAIMMARLFGAKVLLGTATPSAESYYNATTGKYALVRLATRYADISLPEIEIVDIKDLRRRKMMSGPFSPRLLEAMRQTFDAGRQVILFQNRRGYAPRAECRNCGWVPRCKNCDVTLTYHRNLNALTCHYCGYTYTMPTTCPTCESTEIVSRGFGTENIEDSIAELFPNMKVARMDLDTTRSRTAYERLIADFSAGNTRILVGTQMISKGLDFGGVGLVGIVDADSMLAMPDFRSYENAFQMMAQVGGRAGRKGKRGLVILQTRQPELPLIRQVVEDRFSEFFSEMMEEREMFIYPPFCRLTTIYLRHSHENIADTAATELASRLRSGLGSRVLGPDKPAVARVKGLYIRKILIKAENTLAPARLREYVIMCKNNLLVDKRYASLQIFFDVDPM